MATLIRKHRRRHRSKRWRARLHFAARFLGLTGLMAALAGWAMSYLDQNALMRAANGQAANWGEVRGLLANNPGVAVHLAVWGTLAAVLALLVEMLAIAFQVAGRRSAFGFNAVLQIALAVTLLAGVNVFSYRHHLRWDCTRDGQFTLPEGIVEQLQRLQGDTTIVVHQRHKKYGMFTEKPDAYDYAAERKVIEKIQDLVEQFRALGKQFHVVVLDVEEEAYDRKLADLTADAAPLRTAIDQAPENSIFFWTKDGSNNVQTLTFSEFYHLDKSSSKAANNGRGNLVLLHQGTEPFARRVLNIQQKKPRIAIAASHEWLSTDGDEEIGLKGLRTVLTARGFEVRDVILKDFHEFDPVVYTSEENKLDRLEKDLAGLEIAIEENTKYEKKRQELLEEWKSSPLGDLAKKYLPKLTEAQRKTVVQNLEEELGLLRTALANAHKRRDKFQQEKDGLSIDSMEEQRRIRDLKVKMERVLADCDLLIVPRLTLVDVFRSWHIAPVIHRLDNSQAEAIKGFLRTGKPVLACFGPTNEPDTLRPRKKEEPDKLETLFADLGIRFGKQTILFDVESEAMAEHDKKILLAGAHVTLPEVTFEWRQGAGRPLGSAVSDHLLRPHPIRESLRLTARSLGKETLDLRLRHPRPVYCDPPKGQDTDPIVMMSDPACWNEEQPFPTRDRVPRYTAPKPDDPTKGTLDEKRRGPFPLAVALETTVPQGWYPSSSDKPATVRVAAIGQAGFFTGTDLAPAKEKFVLDTCNWLLGRDDLLVKPGQTWEYPRTSLPERTITLWEWAARFGLPLIFVYLGIVVLLVRRLR